LCLFATIALQGCQLPKGATASTGRHSTRCECTQKDDLRKELRTVLQDYGILKRNLPTPVVIYLFYEVPGRSCEALPELIARRHYAMVSWMYLTGNGAIPDRNQAKKYLKAAIEEENNHPSHGEEDMEILLQTLRESIESGNTELSLSDLWTNKNDHTTYGYNVRFGFESSISHVRGSIAIHLSSKNYPEETKQALSKLFKDFRNYESEDSERIYWENVVGSIRGAAAIQSEEICYKNFQTLVLRLLKRETFQKPSKKEIAIADLKLEKALADHRSDYSSESYRLGRKDDPHLSHKLLDASELARRCYVHSMEDFIDALEKRHFLKRISKEAIRIELAKHRIEELRGPFAP
jgi:hypothetical protein